MDIGVNPNIFTKETEEYAEKKKYVTSSLYDYILKLLEGPNQFTDPDAALNHPFITTAASYKINRPSDI